MTRPVTPEEADELVDLWMRLDRLKVGIGGWVITAATRPASSEEAIWADDRIRSATEAALAVRERINALTHGPDDVLVVPVDEPAHRITHLTLASTEPDRDPAALPRPYSLPPEHPSGPLPAVDPDEQPPPPAARTGRAGQPVNLWQPTQQPPQQRGTPGSHRDRR